jgi:carbonic anhydrase/acetyltransferase-like protein (isoleucine patch superfamily)
VVPQSRRRAGAAVSAEGEVRGPPLVAASAFVHPRASVCGWVTLGEHVSVWAGAVLRGDADQIAIGDASNIQDLVMVHADLGVPTHVGARVTVGHRAILHGCRVDDDVLIGMGAILLNRCHIGTGSIIGAGALIPEGLVVPVNSLMIGVPAKAVRSTTEAERARLALSAKHYQQLAAAHRDGVVRYHPVV